MAKVPVILLSLLILASCIPVPLSDVDIRKETGLGFAADDLSPKKETVSFTCNKPGVTFQPTLKISGYEQNNIKLSLTAVSNEEMYVAVSVETIKLQSYWGIFPPFIPLFPYVSDTLIPSQRDENFKVRIFYSAREPQENYRLADMYLEDGIKKIYPLEKFDLKIAKGGKESELLSIEFPITNREAEGKILHLDTIRSDSQRFSPVSGELKLFKSWNKTWTFFGGFICINC